MVLKSCRYYTPASMFGVFKQKVMKKDLKIYVGNEVHDRFPGVWVHCIMVN